MSVKGSLKSLDKIRAKVEEKSGFSGDDESPFLTIKDKESYSVRFLQEIDDEVATYDERRGLIAVVEEHTGQGPEGYKRRAVCTIEEDGRCWACEQTTLPEVGKKWKPRMRFYANVIVRGENGGEDKVKILAQGFGDKNIGKMLIGYNDEYEGLGGQDFKVSRTGAGMNDTSYMMMPRPPKALSDADLALELKDLGKFIKYVPYENQADFYAGNEVESDSTSGW